MPPMVILEPIGTYSLVPFPSPYTLFRPGSRSPSTGRTPTPESGEKATTSAPAATLSTTIKPTIFQVGDFVCAARHDADCPVLLFCCAHTPCAFHHIILDNSWTDATGIWCCPCAVAGR